MHILVLIAGTNHPSNSETLANAFVDGIKDFSPTTSIKTVRLDSLNIEHFSLKFYEPSADQGADFTMIQNEINKANGVVIASPIWNFGVPAHLKNLIDRIGSFALDDTHSIGQLKGKPFYIIHTGGISKPGWLGLMKGTTSHLPRAIQYFGGTVIDTHYEGSCTAGKGIFKEVVSGRPESIKTVKEKGKKFAEVVEIFTNEGTLPMQHSASKWFWEMGGKIKKAAGL